MVPPNITIRLLISGGPGSGCTSTAQRLGEKLDTPVFDSDAYFHKPSDPPFQEQYSPAERRVRLEGALFSNKHWIVSGSVASWGLRQFEPTHGVLLEIPPDVRLARLIKRQRARFGNRIDPGGDMRKEHESFMTWAAGYEGRFGNSRNLATDREFLTTKCQASMSVDEVMEFAAIVEQIERFLTKR